MALLTLASCSKGGSQPADGADQASLTLPVSELKLCRDWHKTFCTLCFDEPDEIYPPQQYLLYDIDGDGRAEVLMREKQANFAAMLSYDKDGRLAFADCTFDGYLELGVGPHWYVRQYDNHMNEYRAWTKYYYQINDGQYSFIGHVEDGLNGVDDEGEYITYTYDNTCGQAPADSLITFFYDLEGWQDISQEALDTYLDHLDDWDDVPLAVGAETESSDQMDEGILPDVATYNRSAEFTLAGGMRGRLDMQVTDGQIQGWTTYYRKNGTTSKICFFGANFYDEVKGQEIYELHEYNNGKCCGHFSIALVDDQLANGTWKLKDKEYLVTSYTPAEYAAAEEPVLASPATDPTLADQLLPCSRQAIRQRLKEEYPDLEGDIDFLLYDMNYDGIYEVLLIYQIGSYYSYGLIWMDGNRPELICGGNTRVSMKVHAPILYVIPEDAGPEYRSYIWRWQDDGKPAMESLDEDENQAMDRSTYLPVTVGGWCSL